MNLLSMFSDLIGNSKVMDLLSNNTRLSTDSIGSLLKKALPMLMSKLTSNASTEEGARSLFNAIGQHATDSSIEEQLGNVDTEDGAKILGHILGDSAESEIGSLAESVGISSDQASSVLSNIAPSLLSNLSSAVTNGLPESTDDAKEEGSGVLGFFGKLFGKKEDGDGEDTSAFDGTNLLNALNAFK